MLSKGQAKRKRSPCEKKALAIDFFLLFQFAEFSIFFFNFYTHSPSPKSQHRSGPTWGPSALAQCQRTMRVVKAGRCNSLVRIFHCNIPPPPPPQARQPRLACPAKKAVTASPLKARARASAQKSTARRPMTQMFKSYCLNDLSPQWGSSDPTVSVTRLQITVGPGLDSQSRLAVSLDSGWTRGTQRRY